jgi:predicted Zn finger-like uncharacterized protein
MTVECPACKTIFPVDPNKVPEGGVHARCSACSQVFFVEPPPARVPPEIAEAFPAPDGEALAREETAEQTDKAPAELEPRDRTLEEPEPGHPEPTFGEPEPTFSMDSPMLEGGPGYDAPLDETPEPRLPGEGEDQPPSGPLFGRRDPMQKAQRLARVLVSDIILYNPDRHRRALDSGRIKEEFKEEIQKSWTEYVEQVGEELATSTSFFEEALSEILVEGEQGS